ncbi:MAG: hypothetical protein AAGC56_11725 [Pseudomonadota bacterium]
MTDPQPYDPPAANDDAEAVRVTTLFERLSAELEQAAQTAGDTQRDVGDVLSSCGTCTAPARLQELDRLTQTLGALADFLAALAAREAARGDVSIAEAARSVPLRALADRLRGERGDETADIAGDCSFF